MVGKQFLTKGRLIARKRYNVGGKGSFKRMPQDSMSHGTNAWDEPLYI